jgi:hypothetical protein
MKRLSSERRFCSWFFAEVVIFGGGALVLVTIVAIAVVVVGLEG